MGTQILTLISVVNPDNKDIKLIDIQISESLRTAHMLTAS